MITRILILINVAAFLWEIFAGGSSVAYAGVPDGTRIDNFLLVPVAVLQYHQYYRMLTAGFLHVNITHVLVNMISLGALGFFVERTVGPLRMFLIYFISLFASSLCVVLFSAPNVPTLGASGAIFGLFGALFAIGLKLGRPGMELIKANLGILILNLFFTFAFSFISKEAHLGGLIAGFLITLVLFWPPRPVSTLVVDANTGVPIESHVEP